MVTQPYQQLKNNLSWALRALLYESYLQAVDTEEAILLNSAMPLSFTDELGMVRDAENQKKILEILKQRGAIDIEIRKKTMLVTLRVGEFDELYQQYVKTMRRVSYILNGSGDIVSVANSKLRYPMGQNSNRLLMVKFLITNPGYHQLKEILNVFEGSPPNKTTLRSEKSKINKNFRKLLKCDIDLIVYRKSSGYGINPSIKISEKG